MSTHPSLPTCSLEPRALWSALSVPLISSFPPMGEPPPPSLSPLRSGHCQRQEEEEGSSPKCRPTEHSSPAHLQGRRQGGRWLKPKSLNREKKRGKGSQGQRGGQPEELQRKWEEHQLPPPLGPQPSAINGNTPIICLLACPSALSGGGEGGQRSERAQKTDRKQGESPTGVEALGDAHTQHPPPPPRSIWI